jgi:hypothetical protein
MKRTQTAISIPALGVLALIGVAMFPLTGLAADDAQADRETRRFENEIRRQQEQAQRDSIDERARVQAEALRSQEESIRRMEAAQARMRENSEQLTRQSAEQSRIYAYPYYPDRTPSTPSTPNLPSEPITPAIPITPASPAQSPGAPAGPVVADRSRRDPVSGMNFAPLSEQLKSYFGAQSGVLVVSAGGNGHFGLQDGDVIISIDGRVPVDGTHTAVILRSYQPGERVRLSVQRNRKVMELDTMAP